MSSDASSTRHPGSRPPRRPGEAIRDVGETGATPTTRSRIGALLAFGSHVSVRDDGAWPRWLRRGPLELIASLIIGAGVLMLLQPLSMALYSYSFVTTLAGVVAFMIVSKLPD
jgi:hypothetical protein